MKQLFTLSFIVLFISSCGTLQQGRLRLVKAEKQEIVSVEKQVVQTDVTPIKIIEASNPSPIELRTTTDQTTDFSTELTEKSPTSNIQFESSIDDSLDQANNDDQLEKALNTEKMATKTTGLFVGGIVTSIVPFLGLIFFLLAVTNYFDVKKQRYNTMRGERFLRANTVLFIVDAIFLTFFIFVMVSLIIAFL
ncbi:MAG: hypothetical protein RI922_2193 [Bacteroidota bacterium]|jgi:uncharacterized membrane protein